MLSFCLRVLNMSHDFIINYSIFGKVSSPSRRKRSTVVSSKTLRVSIHLSVSPRKACEHRSGEGWRANEARPH